MSDILRGQTHLVATYAFISTVMFIIQPVLGQTNDTASSNKTPQEIMSRMKERLHLTEDQINKITPIIEESVNKRREITENNMLDKKTMKSSLQQLQFVTDMKLGQILTKEQLEEYQSHREEQTDATQSGDMQHGRGGGHGGGLHGF